ncbi:hypothetical protein Tco_1304571 [Tanacetum coccineum]
MLRPLGFEEGPFMGPSTGPSTGPSIRSSRRRLGGFEEKARGLLRTQQRLDSVSVLCEGWRFPCGHTPKGVGLRVADSHTGNHPEDDFTPPKTFEGFPSAFGM